MAAGEAAARARPKSADASGLSECRMLPADPLADRAPHDQFLVGSLEPRQLVGEHRDALPVAARHPGDVGPPEAPRRTEGVENLPDVLVDVAIRVGLARIARRARQLDCDIGTLGDGEHLAEIGESAVVGPGAATAAASVVVDVELEAGMALGDPVEGVHVAAGQQPDRQLFALAGGPEPVERTVGPPRLLVRLVEGEAEAEHARPLPPVLDDLLAVRRLQIEIAED